MAKILVVDDEDRIRTMVVTMLRMAGFETMEAENGMSAFELAKANGPSLIISDVMMYNGSGFILREFLKTESTTSKIPMILMSGKAQDAGAWGADPNVEYIEKPFTDKELFSAIKRMLEPG